MKRRLFLLLSAASCAAWTHGLSITIVNSVELEDLSGSWLWEDSFLVDWA